MVEKAVLVTTDKVPSKKLQSFMLEQGFDQLRQRIFLKQGEYEQCEKFQAFKKIEAIQVFKCNNLIIE